MSEYGYIPESPAQSFGNNTGIFTPNDIYDLTRADKYTEYGQLELIQTQTYSGAVSYVDFTNLGDYNVHLLTYNDVMPADNNARVIQLQFYENGTLETGSVYHYAYQYNYISGNSEINDTNDTEIELSYEVGNTTPCSSVGYCYMYNLTDSTKYSFTTSHTCRCNTSTFSGAIFGSGCLPQKSFVDGFRLKTNSGNFASFDFSLYGIKEYS